MPVRNVLSSVPRQHLYNIWPVFIPNCFCRDASDSFCKSEHVETPRDDSLAFNEYPTPAICTDVVIMHAQTHTHHPHPHDNYFSTCFPQNYCIHRLGLVVNFPCQSAVDSHSFSLLCCPVTVQCSILRWRAVRFSFSKVSLIVVIASYFQIYLDESSVLQENRYDCMNAGALHFTGPTPFYSVS